MQADSRRSDEQSTTSEDLGGDLYDYHERFLASVVRVVTTVVASLLPVCSVVMLYFAISDAVRLGLVVLSSGMFALALSLMTSARKIEVFAATSA